MNFKFPKNMSLRFLCCIQHKWLKTTINLAKLKQKNIYTSKIETISLRFVFFKSTFGAMYTLLDKFLVKLNRIISGNNSIFCPLFYTFFLINLMPCNILFGLNTPSSNWICIERPPNRKKYFVCRKHPKLIFLTLVPEM